MFVPSGSKEPDPQQPLLSFEELTLCRGLDSKPIVHQLSLTLESGRILWLQGANGTGKTSLLKAAAGIISPLKGAVKTHASIGWVGYDNALKPHLTARANLLLSPFPKPKEGWDEIAAQFGAEKLLDIPVAELSAGQRRRICLTRLLGSNTQIWLLDEADAGLDAEGSGLLKKAMLAHTIKGGAIMAASHHPFKCSIASTLKLGEDE